MSVSSINSAFKTQLVAFLDDLIQLLPTEQEIVASKVLIDTETIPISLIVEYFVEKLIPFKSMILERNESFFLDNNFLFEDLELGKVNYFRQLWLYSVDDENKNILWAWFDTFIKLSERYIKITKNEK